jgi:uncharacterized RDD family membrane protein YckC
VTEFEGVRVRRAVAYCIDAAIMGLIAGVAWTVFPAIAGSGLKLAAPMQIWLTALLPALYPILTIGAPGSATLGMHAMALRVTTTDGGAAGYRQAAVMVVAFYVSVTVTTPAVLLVALFNQRGRCLHDWIAGVLVRRRTT